MAASSTDANYGCLVADSSASQIAISLNQMQCGKPDDLDSNGVAIPGTGYGVASVLLYQGWAASFGATTDLPSLPAPNVLVSGNRITCTGYASGVRVQDASALYTDPVTLAPLPFRLNAAIAANTITLANNGTDAGIDGVYGQGIQVLGNKISGTGLAGIAVGTFGSLWGLPSAPASGWQIKGNDVSGVTPTNTWYEGVSTAQIWLGADASGCTVVGGKAPTTALDQGTGNSLTNVTIVTP